MHTCAHQLMSGHLLWILNCIVLSVCFFFNDTATTEIYTLSLHDALPIWVLTDYTVENGTFYMVPGSHRFCRHPTELEQPKFMGGVAPDDIGTPVLAEAGSLIVFHGNTWHGTVPKMSEGPRVHVANAFCRNYVNP